jgi:hypothetical protein
MAEMNHNRIVIDPRDVEHALQQLALIYDLDADTLMMVRQAVTLYTRPVTLYVDESRALFYSQTPLVDKFTFNIQTDELVLFSRDPMTFVDATIEMAMYIAGFSTMMGVEEYWKVEFTIGAWKPVKNRIKRDLGIPVIDEPLWIVGLPPNGDGSPPDDPHPFRTLVSQLDIASFTQMVRLAARDDVEVNFPIGTDPRVIQVYIRIKTAMFQVADGLTLESWREFNRRLLGMVQDLEEEYNPGQLPVPGWWQRAAGSDERDADLQFSTLDFSDNLPAPDFDDLNLDQDRWDPFARFIEELFNDED